MRIILALLSVSVAVTINGQEQSSQVEGNAGGRSVTIVTPSHHAIVMGTGELVVAEINSQDTPVTVTFLLDGHAFTAPQVRPPYTARWNTMSSSNGRHTLHVRAQWSDGSISSTNIIVYVHNAAMPQGWHNIIVEEFGKLTNGFLLINLPEMMIQGRTYAIEATVVSFEIGRQMARTNRPPIILEEIRVGPAMEMKLTSHDSNVVVQALTTTEQFVGPNKTTWVWSFRPLASGKNSLFLFASLPLEIPSVGTHSMNMFGKEVTVHIVFSPGFAVATFFRENWPQILGAGLAVVVTVIGGYFVKRINTKKRKTTKKRTRKTVADKIQGK